MLSEFRFESGTLSNNWAAIFGAGVTDLLPPEIIYPQLFSLSSLIVVGDGVVGLRIGSIEFESQPVRSQADLVSRIGKLVMGEAEALELRLVTGNAQYRLSGVVAANSALEQQVSGVSLYTV